MVRWGLVGLIPVPASMAVADLRVEFAISVRAVWEVVVLAAVVSAEVPVESIVLVMLVMVLKVTVGRMEWMKMTPKKEGLLARSQWLERKVS